MRHLHWKNPPLWDAISLSLVLVAYTWFCLAVLFSVPSIPFSYDPAVHALIAKYIAYGHGWVSSEGGNVSHITTNTSGPVLILPTALFTWMLGNQIWVPALSAAVVNLVALGVVVGYSRRVLPSSQWAAFSIALLFFFSYFEPEWWCFLVGDVTCYLFLMLAILITSDPGIARENNRYFYVGMAVGFSIYSKMMAIPGYAVIAAYLLGNTLLDSRGENRTKRLLSVTGSGLAGLALVLVGVRFVDYYTYLSNSHYSFVENFLFRLHGWTMEIGTRHASNPFDIKVIIGNINNSLNVLTTVLDRYQINLVFFLALNVFFCIAHAVIHPKEKPEQQSGAYIVERILIMAMLLYAIQFFAFSKSPFDHHSFHFLYSCMVVLIVMTVRILGPAGIVLVILSFFAVSGEKKNSAYTGLLSLKGMSLEWGHDARLYNKDLMEVTGFIKQHEFRYPLATNCGWMIAVREVEYLLPDSRSYIDCYNLIEQSLVFDEQGYLEKYPEVIGYIQRGEYSSAEIHYRKNFPNYSGKYVWKQPVSFTLVTGKAPWRLAKTLPPSKARQNLLVKACRDVIYSNSYYRVMECPFASLAKEIPDDATNPFAKMPPVWSKRAYRYDDLLSRNNVYVFE